MKESERRFTPRAALSVPITFRALTDPDAPEETAESVNFSRRGVYFATSMPLCEGTPVEMHFSMPEEISGKPKKEWKCVGRVVHVDVEGLPGGSYGVGVQFDYYELVA
jgi:PilZ domain